MTNILFKIARICHSQFKWNYLENEKHFLNFLFHFWTLHQILNILKENIIVIANVFPKLLTVKNLYRILSKRQRFRAWCDSQHVKRSQILAKCPWEHFYHVFSSFSGKLIWKMAPLVLCQIFSVFVKSLTVDGKYPVQDFQYLQLPIQMQLSQKRKTFCEFFVLFLEFTSNFKCFERKDDRHS